MQYEHSKAALDAMAEALGRCLYCKVELEPSKGKKPKLYCSDKCRKRYKRTEQTDKVTNGQVETDSSSVEPDVIPEYSRRHASDPMALAEDKTSTKPPKPQSYNPMMVGYVPPRR